jgi:hypothetical protein
MLEEEESSFGFQHPADALQGVDDARNRAEREGTDDGIDSRVLERDPLTGKAEEARPAS